MKKITSIVFVGLVVSSFNVFGQKGSVRIFDDPILTDTLSTLFIPTRYNEQILSHNKIAFWGDYYANIIVYNFKTDSSKKLFLNDTYIKSLRSDYSYGTRGYERVKNLCSGWVFLLVKPTDTNGSGRIDEDDASVLMTVSTDGRTVKQLTDGAEDVAEIIPFEKQGFILIKIQRERDQHKSISHGADFYFKKIDLADLTLGKTINAN
jgi:hypothetical protein